MPDKHYMIPALERLPEVARLIDRGQSFVVHAARQSGKTTALLALVSEINSKATMRAVYFTLEAVQRFPRPQEGIPRIAAAMRNSLLSHRFFGKWAKDMHVVELSPGVMVPDVGVKTFLSNLAAASDRPLAVFFDEVDCLSDDTLITFLRELRDGVVNSRSIDPDSRFPFPVSLALVGMRDIRDYKAQIRSETQTLGSASPFNIITEDYRLRNFNAEEVAALYAQHTEATGQVFEDAAKEESYRLTCGQPWLVNAIARECVEKIHAFRYDEPITAPDIDAAKEALIRARGTHVDSLMERLKEDRVRKVVEPVILGRERGAAANDEDYRYVMDLGLLKDDGDGLRPSNPMYTEIILRYLSHDQQQIFKTDYPSPFWLRPDGTLDMPKLMVEFQKFWRENSEADREVYGYKEATPHLVMCAYLQRVVNGGGRITREMALGSGRLDLCVEFRGQRYALELKMRRNFSREKSLTQFVSYLDRLGLAEGWMPIFDDDKAKSWDERLCLHDESLGGKTIHVVGL